MRGFLVALLLVAGCHGKSSTTTGGGGGAGGGSDEAQCEPGRCLDDISKAIAEHRTESRACYDAAAKKTPGLTGRIIINFRIDAQGAVTEASQGMQDEQIQDDALVACVVDVINKVTFAASKLGKTTRAYHQFEFGSNGDGGK
jgi:hypothetical protein